jgi:DHA2 family multidrug resistance protein
MGLFSVGVTVALGLGPSLGGLTIDLFDWRTIFLVPIPACLVASLLGIFFLPEAPHKTKPERFDIFGFVLLTFFVFGWFSVLGNGQRWGWFSDELLVLAVATFISGLCFALSQWRRPGSLVDLSILRNPPFMMALACAFLFAFGNFGAVYSFSIFGQIVQGFSPTVAGSMLLPGSLFAALILPLTGWASDKLSAPLIMLLGLIVIFSGVLMLVGADANTAFWYVATSLLLTRIGTALTNPAINMAAISCLRPESVAQGAGITNLAMMFGGSTGISVFVIALEQRIEFHASSLAATQVANNGSTLELLAKVDSLLLTESLTSTVREGVAMFYLDAVVTAQANALGFKDGFFLLSVVALVPLIPIVFLLRRRQAGLR